MKQKIIIVLINNFLIKKSFIIVFGIYTLAYVNIMTKKEKKGNFTQKKNI